MARSRTTLLGRGGTLVSCGLIRPWRRDGRSGYNGIERMSCTRDRVTILLLQWLWAHRRSFSTYRDRVPRHRFTNRNLLFYIRTGHPWPVELLSSICWGPGLPLVGLRRVLQVWFWVHITETLLSPLKPRHTFWFVLLGLAPLLPEVLEFCPSCRRLDGPVLVTKKCRESHWSEFVYSRGTA